MTRAEKDNAVQQHQQQSIIQERHHAQRPHGRLQVVSTLARQEQHQHVRLQQSDERHAGRCQSRGVGKDVNTQSGQETAAQDSPLGEVTAEKQHDVNIQQRRGETKKMDMVEHQHLQQQEQDEE